MNDRVADLWSGEPRCAEGCASPAALARAAGQTPRPRGDSALAYQAAYERCAACYGWVCSRCGRVPGGSSGAMCEPCDTALAAMDGGADDGS